MATKHVKQTILVPIDFSSYSEAAIFKACEFAECLKLPVTLLHVVHDSSELPGYYEKMARIKQPVKIEDVAAEMLHEYMEKLINSNPKNSCLAKARRLLVKGLPVTRILEVAKQENACMIVMGSQGRTGLDRIMLGSKAEQVVRLSPLPVTIVKSK